MDSSGGPLVQWSRTICAILIHGEHFCEIIFNKNQWFRCPLKYFLSTALAALLFTGGEPFVQFRVESILGNISVKLF